MFAYIARRILSTIPLLIFALYIVHVSVSFTTDPLADKRLCLPRCQDAYDLLVEQYDLDTNIFVRPLGWMADAATGDLGMSNSIGEPVTEVLVSRGWNTAMIAIPAFVLTAVIALGLSIYSATHKYSAGDYSLTALSFIGVSLPTFVIGLLLSTFWGIWWQDWTGTKPFYTTGKYSGSFGQLLACITLPIATLVIGGIANDSRFGRAAMLDVLDSDYIRTARAKGLTRRRIVWRHALRNALIPLVTLWALEFAVLLSGSLITETVFSWPGLGPAFVTALGKPDINLVLGITTFGAVLTIGFNLLADILYGVLDPRIRYD